MAEEDYGSAVSSYDETENDDSSRTSSVLSLHYSSSPFQSDNSSFDDEDSHQVEPYLYEPEAEGSPDAAGESSDDDSRTERLGNTEWCQCGNCEVMPTPTECVCCQEITAIDDKIGTSETSAIQCIVDHEGFDAVCLNVWVLQASYFTYRQHYGTRDVRDEPQHEQYRFMAYRQLTGWCWGWLGRRMRVTLPCCAVNKIRTKFPSADGNYTGFKYPSFTP